MDWSLLAGIICGLAVSFIVSGIKSRKELGKCADACPHFENTDGYYTDIHGDLITIYRRKHEASRAYQAGRDVRRNKSK